MGWSSTSPGRPGTTVAISFPRKEVTPLIVYIAGFFDAQQRLRAVRAQLKSMTSWVIRSRWLDETATQATFVTPPDRSDEYRHYAKRDLDDIMDCDRLFVDTFDITPRGGREVEVGYAHALDIPFIVVGPKRNVFHELSIRHFEHWDDVYEAIRRKELA